jgi:hypothetical protein
MQGRFERCHMKHGGCAIVTGVERKREQENKIRGTTRRMGEGVLIETSRAATRQGAATMPKKGAA